MQGLQVHNYRTYTRPTFDMRWYAMIGENRQLVTDEPVEFDKLPVEVQDFRRITDHFKGIL